MEIPAPYNVGGRPKKNDEEKRSEKLQTHLTFEEAEEIKLNCHLAGMTVSEFLRNLALDKEITPRENSEDLKSIRANLGRAVGLLNQIAVQSNSGIRYNKNMLDDLCDELKETLEQL